MQALSCQVLKCRYCRFYTPEGRRGGQCDRLNAPVLGNWVSCSLALPPFAPVWELHDVTSRHQAARLQNNRLPFPQAQPVANPCSGRTSS